MASVLGGESIGPVQVCALLAGLSPEELTKEARIAVGRRYTSFKLKVGARAIAADAKQVASLRMAIGNDFSIRLDANRAWTLDQAEVAMRAFQPYGIEFLEEPCARRNRATCGGSAMPPGLRSPSMNQSAAPRRWARLSNMMSLTTSS